MVSEDRNSRIVPVRIEKCALVLCLTLAILPRAGAQTLYHLNLKGTASALGPGGVMFDQPVNNATVIREWAARAGQTNANLKSLDLVLHPNNGPGGGDSIDVVNKSDGSLVNRAFRLAFDEPAADSSGASARKFFYVFTVEQSASVGTVILNERTVIKNGQTNKFAADGEMQWYQLPQGTNSLRLFTAKLKTGKALKFH